MVAFLLALTFAPAVHAGWGNWGLSSFTDTSTSEPTFTSETTCLDFLEWCQDPHNFWTKNCGNFMQDTPAPTTSNLDPSTCQNLYNMLDQNNCILQAFRSTNAPCAGIPVPEYNTHTLNVLETSVACERFSKRQMECVPKFAKINPTIDEVNEAVDCILDKAGRHKFKNDKDAQTCLKYPDVVANTNAETDDEPTARPTLSGMVKEPTARPTLSGMVLKEPTARPTLSGMEHKHKTAKCGCICPIGQFCNVVYDCTPAERQAQLANCPMLGSTTDGDDDNKIPFIPMATGDNNNDAGNHPVYCTEWICPCWQSSCPGRRLLTGAPGTSEENTDKIPFIPMMAAATIPSDPTCLDVLEWCNDSHNFMVKDCPSFSTAKDFDPRTCQSLYTIIGQSDCILRAFLGLIDEDPCANVQLPYGDYDEEALDLAGEVVSCENFSFANGLCVEEFSKLNPTDDDYIRAFKCIFNAAKQPKFADDQDAKECLMFKAMLPGTI